MTKWQLRFEPKRLQELASRYEYEDDQPILALGRRAREAGEYSHEDFLTLCRWKSPRSRARCRQNTAEEVVEITRIALATVNERLRIGALRCLHGVDWPTASVLLHFAHRDPYPVLDVRALWSWGFDKRPVYTFDLWWRYVQECRALADEQGVDLRTMDRALWQYSKEHQAAFSQP